MAAPRAGAGSSPDAGDATLRSAALPGLEAWWAEPGRAGSMPAAWLSPAFPRVYAGHVLGGIGLADDGRAAPPSPWPGSAADTRPLAWSDSVRAELAPAGGPGGTLARAEAGREVPGIRSAWAMFGYTTGDNNVEETSLLAERGDAQRGLRYEVLSASRGAAGSLGPAGRHFWGVSGRTVRGRHRFEAAYAQRGTHDALASFGASESARGESGRLGWRWSDGSRDASLVLARAYEGRESYGDWLAYSRRDASEDRATLTAGGRAGIHTLGAEVRWSSARVRRAWTEVADWRTESVWGVARAARPLGEGTLEAALAGGRHDAVGGWRVAPSLAYRFAAVGVKGTASLARIVTPAWSDLAPGERAFLQRTWAGGFDLAAGEGRARARLAFLGGTTHDRALVGRAPLAELWLRQGLRRERGRAPFALTLASVGWDARGFETGAEGFVLAQRDGARTADPDHGFRAHAGVRLGFFGGDLHLTARGEVEGSGPRAVDGAPELRVPGFASAGAALTLRLADATVTLRARNLEDRRREEPWIDPATGALAFGTGRELRFALGWAIAD